MTIVIGLLAAITIAVAVFWAFGFLAGALVAIVTGLWRFWAAAWQRAKVAKKQ